MLVHCSFALKEIDMICVATPCLAYNYFHPQGFLEREKMDEIGPTRHAPQHPFANLKFDEFVVNCIGRRTEKKLEQVPSLTIVHLLTFPLHTPVEQFSE